MTRFVGLDVSQKITAISVVDDAGRRLWRGQCPTNPEQISTLVRRYAGDDARIGIETGAMTPWLVHELRNLSLEVVCLDARHARAALNNAIPAVVKMLFCNGPFVVNPSRHLFAGSLFCPWSTQWPPHDGIR
jgi:hypothetical protein